MTISATLMTMATMTADFAGGDDSGDDYGDDGHTGGKQRCRAVKQMQTFPFSGSITLALREGSSPHVGSQGTVL